VTLRGLVRGLLLLALLLGAGSCLEGQASTQAALRIMVELTGLEDRARLPYLDSLEASLIQSPAALAVIQAPKGEGSLEQRAEHEACALAVQVGLSIDAEQLRIEWTIFEPPRQESVAQGAVEKDLPDARALSTGYWLELIDAIEQSAVGLEAPKSFMVVEGQPGTVVSGIGGDIVLPESGQVELALALPAYIVWSATFPGARRERGTRIVTESGTTLVIPRRALPPPSRLSIDSALYGLSFPELGLRWDVGRRFYLRAMITQYLAGLALQGEQGLQISKQPAGSLLTSLDLLQPGLGAGYMFSQEAAKFRLYTSLDLFARLAFPEGRQAMLDPVAPLGTQLALGFDWGERPALRLYAELGVAVYPWAFPGLMMASWSGQGFPRFVGGAAGLFPGHPGWFAEFPVPRLGLRIHL